MGFNCGIIGLPNVGKSTIFNALTSAGAEAANYPFWTIEPNTGVVPVPDPRIDALAGIAHSEKIIPTAVEFVDIAGLVRGASKGEGLGNQFLGHIRAVDALVHVVRCFVDEDIVHVDGSISPARDAEIIEMELILADLDSVQRRIDKVSKIARGGDKAAKAELEWLQLAKPHLEKGEALRTLEPPEEASITQGLLTVKPLFYVANVSESQAAMLDLEKAEGPLRELVDAAEKSQAPVVVISGKVESEVSQLEPEERAMFLEELGLESSGLARLALQGYRILDLLTFFTVGPKEARAWTCRKGTPAVEAAGIIHTDFSRGFIRAEVIGYDDYLSSSGEQGARERGQLRLEGKQYQMQDGDVVHFRFNV